MQCVYTKSSDLQIQGTTLQGKMNTTLIQDPTSSNDPIFVQCNVRLFTRHCAAYLSANFNDDQFVKDFIMSVKMVEKQVAATKDPTDFIFHKVGIDLRRTEDDICFFMLCYSALKACYDALFEGRLK